MFSWLDLLILAQAFTGAYVGDIYHKIGTNFTCIYLFAYFLFKA